MINATSRLEHRITNNENQSSLLNSLLSYLFILEFVPSLLSPNAIGRQYIHLQDQKGKIVSRQRNFSLNFSILDYLKAILVSN